MIILNLTDVEGKQYRFSVKQVSDKLNVTVQFLSKDQVETKTMEMDTERSVVEIGEQFGIELPYSCRAGACTTCLCKVDQGKDFLDQNKLGEPIIDLMEDEFLTCIGGMKQEFLTDDEEHVVTGTIQNA